MNTWALVALMGTAFTVFADNGSPNPNGAAIPNATAAQPTNNPTHNNMMSNPTQGEHPDSMMTTQMTEDDKVLRKSVEDVLKKGGFVGVTATVSAGNVSLKGTVQEDKLQGLVDTLAKINKGNPPVIDEVITSKIVPHAPTAPTPPPTPAAPTTPNAPVNPNDPTMQQDTTTNGSIPGTGTMEGTTQTQPAPTPKM